MPRPQLKVFESPDKKYHRLGTNDTLAFPARCILAAPVSFGKNSCMLNLVAREPGGFHRHIVVHHCPERTRDFDILSDSPGFELRNFNEDPFPGPGDFTDPKCKSVVILDEIPFLTMNKQQKSDLDRLLNTCSSHGGAGVSVYILCQNIFDCPISVRRACQYYGIWRSPIALTNGLISRMLGVNLTEIMDRLFSSRYDMVLVDLTGDASKLRLNCFNPIRI